MSPLYDPITPPVVLRVVIGCVLAMGVLLAAGAIPAAGLVIAARRSPDPGASVAGVRSGLGWIAALLIASGVPNASWAWVHVNDLLHSNTILGPSKDSLLALVALAVLRLPSLAVVVMAVVARLALTAGARADDTGHELGLRIALSTAIAASAVGCAAGVVLLWFVYVAVTRAGWYNTNPAVVGLTLTAGEVVAIRVAWEVLRRSWTLLPGVTDAPEPG